MSDEEKDFSDEIDTGYEGFCYACDMPGPIDDIGLCQDCSGKIERDMIRLEDWDRSANAWAMGGKSREKLRKDVIKKYGWKLELLVDESYGKRKKKKEAASKMKNSK